MIEIEPHRDGVLLAVRAAPGSRKAGLRGEQNGALKVAVTQIAEGGKANKALLDVLAKSLKLRRSQIELVSGAASASKRFLIRAVSVEELRERVDSLLESARS